MDEMPVDLRHQFGGYEAGNVAEQVLRPVRLHGHDCNRKIRFSPQSRRGREKTKTEKDLANVFNSVSVTLG